MFVRAPAFSQFRFLIVVACVLGLCSRPPRVTWPVSFHEDLLSVDTRFRLRGQLPGTGSVLGVVTSSLLL